MHACIYYSQKTRFDTVIREFQSIHKVVLYFTCYLSLGEQKKRKKRKVEIM